MSYFDDGRPHGPSTNYAQFERKIIPLNCRIGQSMAQYLLGFDNDILEAIVGRYSRGKRKGQLRGAITYLRCNHGGWVTGKGLQRKGVAGEISLVDSFTGRPIYIA